MRCAFFCCSAFGEVRICRWLRPRYALFYRTGCRLQYASKAYRLGALSLLSEGPTNSGEDVQEIAAWLKQLGLGQYAQRFAENEIDVSVLPNLTDQDLKEIGVPLGHRRKILAAISEPAAAQAASLRQLRLAGSAPGCGHRAAMRGLRAAIPVAAQ